MENLQQQWRASPAYEMWSRNEDLLSDRAKAQAQIVELILAARINLDIADKLQKNVDQVYKAKTRQLQDEMVEKIGRLEQLEKDVTRSSKLTFILSQAVLIENLIFSDKFCIEAYAEASTSNV